MTTDALFDLPPTSSVWTNERFAKLEQQFSIKEPRTIAYESIVAGRGLSGIGSGHYGSNIYLAGDEAVRVPMELEREGFSFAAPIWAEVQSKSPIVKAASVAVKSVAELDAEAHTKGEAGGTLTLVPVGSQKNNDDIPVKKAAIIERIHFGSDGWQTSRVPYAPELEAVLDFSRTPETIEIHVLNRLRASGRF